MKTHALALALPRRRCSRLGACNKDQSSGEAPEGADLRGREGRRRQDHRRRPRRRTASSWPRPRPPGSTRRSPAPAPIRSSFPDDAAFARRPPARSTRRPSNRAQLTGILTNLILPGTVLVADIGKAIDNGKGKARAGDDGRRDPDRDQGGRQDRPDRCRRPQGDRSPRRRRPVLQRRRPPRRCRADAAQGQASKPAVGQKAGSKAQDVAIGGSSAARYCFSHRPTSARETARYNDPLRVRMMGH